MTPSSPAILVHDLVKRYGTATAVDGLSFEVYPGEVFALLGPNGAGKTTAVEIMEGYKKPDEGEVRVLGLNPVTQGGELKPLIGAMLQEGGLYATISPREALDLFAHFYPHHRQSEELLGLVGLEGQAGTRYRRLSGGQKQRLALALALVGEPRLVFLDEPTAGLDPQARRATWEIISALREREVTILLTTHYLEEAERLADRVAIINHGQLVALGAPASLLEGERQHVRLRTALPIEGQILAALPFVSSVRRDGMQSYILQTDDPARLLVDITMCLWERRVPILELRVGQGSLEDVYLELTGAAV